MLTQLLHEQITVSTRKDTNSIKLIAVWSVQFDQNMQGSKRNMFVLTGSHICSIIFVINLFVITTNYSHNICQYLT
jgi:hypothetical protein